MILAAESTTVLDTPIEIVRSIWSLFTTVQSWFFFFNPTEAKNLICSMLNVVSINRPSLRQVLRHPWFSMRGRYTSYYTTNYPWLSKALEPGNEPYWGCAEEWVGIVSYCTMGLLWGRRSFFHGFHWLLLGCAGTWFKTRSKKQSHDWIRHNTDPLTRNLSRWPRTFPAFHSSEQI